MVTLLALSCALTVGQAADRTDWPLGPQLAPGLELVYHGTYLEEALGQHVQHQRRYRLETTLLVLDGRPGGWDVAILTALGLQDGRAGAEKGGAAPQSVRLELARVDAQGPVRGADGRPLSLPVMGPPQVEFGFLPEAPVGRVGRGHYWEVAEAGRPPRGWTVAGPEAVNGVTCVKVVGQQQSDTWDHPRDGQTAWRRTDTLWLSPQLAVAQKVERVVERRAPARQAPTERAVVRYELQSPLKYPGRLFDERRQEVRKAAAFAAEAAPLLRQPAGQRTAVDALLRKIGYHLDAQPPTPYRLAILHLQRGLEAARRGEAPPQVEPDEPAAVVRAVAVGQRVPDFVVSSLTEKDSARLSRLLGRPVLVLFYNPATAAGRDVMQYARRLALDEKDGVAIMAMAVTPDPAVARKQRDDLGLPFPILDGQGMRLTFGVEHTPRLVLLDGDGVVRCALTGWGLGTPGEIAAELSRCRPPR